MWSLFYYSASVHSSSSFTTQFQMAGRVKLGPWGGNGGDSRDITNHPTRLTKIEIYSGDQSINSIKFECLLQDGTSIPVGPWGNAEGRLTTIEFGEDEYLNDISGTTGSINDGADRLTSLTFANNRGRVWPFGVKKGTPFSVPIEHGRIVAFFGRFSTLVDAIGIYLLPN